MFGTVCDVQTTFTVPKSYFLHFYVLGLMVNGLNVVVHWYVDGVAQSFWSGGCAEALLQCPPHLASALLFQVHLARRAYECVFVHKFSPQARMTWMVYVGGLAHYFMVPFSFHPATTSGVRCVRWRVAAVCFVCRRHRVTLWLYGTGLSRWRCF